MKQCSKCKRVLPDSSFRYRKDNGKLRGVCIVCRKKQDKDYYQKNRGKKREGQKKYEEKNKDRIKEYRYENRDAIKKRRKIYLQQEHVKQRNREQRRKYRQENLEEMRKRERLHYPKIKEKRKQYYQKNKEKELLRNRKWYEKNLKKKKQYDIEYRKNHLFEHRQQASNRRLKINKIIQNFTKEEWGKLVDSTKGICPNCDQTYEEGYGLTMDHTPPISKAPEGFIYTIQDIKPLCRSCNSSKGVKICNN